MLFHCCLHFLNLFWSFFKFFILFYFPLFPLICFNCSNCCSVPLYVLSCFVCSSFKNVLILFNVLMFLSCWLDQGAPNNLGGSRWILVISYCCFCVIVGVGGPDPMRVISCCWPGHWICEPPTHGQGVLLGWIKVPNQLACAFGFCITWMVAFSLPAQ